MFPGFEEAMAKQASGMSDTDWSAYKQMTPEQQMQRRADLKRQKAAAGEMGKKEAPPPPDYQGLAKDQARMGAQYNRPNQQNAFGAGVNWTQDANGNWTQTQSFGGPMGGLFGSLQGQAVDAMGQPMDWGQFGKVGTGEDAANQAYSQMTSRLDPQWEQREDAERTRLINQGFAEDADGYKNAMREFGNQRNDAYGAARTQAFDIGRGVFQDNLASRHQAIAEALQKRGQAFGELDAMRGFMASPDYMGVDGPNLLGAAGAEGDYWMQKVANDNAIAGSIVGGLFGGLGGLAGGMGNFFGNRRK